MTKEEFIEAYCARSGVDWEWLSSRRQAVPCLCADPECAGWKMVPHDFDYPDERQA